LATTRSHHQLTTSPQPAEPVLASATHGACRTVTLKTLDLIERQYAGTWWEQYAHIKDAVIFEKRQGKPQKALERYRATLEKFPSHKYGPFIRRQINRIQGVIEQKLIDDALKGVKGGESEPAQPHSLAHYTAAMMGLEVQQTNPRVSLRE